MMEIKICGITNTEDAMLAAMLGVDALGFIFYPKSLRYIAPETARDIIKMLPQNIAKVGVFVNHVTEEVKEIFNLCGLDFIQLHGDESKEYCELYQLHTLIKAVFLKDEEDLNLSKLFPVKTLLIDSRDAVNYGGTGKKSNWELAEKIAKWRPVILAGGLNSDNILDAIERVAPHAVDINSGVELSPGNKDPKKMTEIVNIIRKNDKRPSGKIFNNTD